MSETSLVTAVIADLFCRLGKEKAVDAVEDWSYTTLENSGVDPSLLKQLFQFYPDMLPKAKVVTPQNMEMISKESSEFRGKVRGIVGRLG